LSVMMTGMVKDGCRETGRREDQNPNTGVGFG
jgi:hypothetical protein